MFILFYFGKIILFQNRHTQNFLHKKLILIFNQVFYYFITIYLLKFMKIYKNKSISSNKWVMFLFYFDFFRCNCKRCLTTYSVVDDIVMAWSVQNENVRLTVLGKIVWRCFFLVGTIQINDAYGHVYSIC